MTYNAYEDAQRALEAYKETDRKNPPYLEDWAAQAHFLAASLEELMEAYRALLHKSQNLHDRMNAAPLGSTVRSGRIVYVKRQDGWHRRHENGMVDTFPWPVEDFDPDYYTLDG